MNLTVLNGTVRQRQWVADALAACTYNFDALDIQANVSFTGLTACSLKHTYMCTSQQGPSLFEVQIEPWADDPKAPDNQGLPDVYRDLHEFFIESFIHEMGHVTCFFLVNTFALQSKLCSYFVHRPDGRRGTLGDYDGPESNQRLWANRIKEAIAEWYRLAFLPHTQIYQNRTNWDLSPDDFEQAMTLLVTSEGWEYGDPIMCSTSINFVDEGTQEVVSAFGGLQDIELTRRSAYNPSFFDETEYEAQGGATFEWAFDYEVSFGAPLSFAALVNDQAGPWGGQGPLLVEFSSGGDIRGSGTDFYFADELPPPIDIFHKPTQPWASHSHMGGPTLGNLDSRSWWTHVRALIRTLTLPPRSEWGKLEITSYSQIPVQRSSTAPGGFASSSRDIHGTPLPGFADDPPPWGGAFISGSGPFPHGLPPFLDQGWVSAYAFYQRPTFISNGTLGQVKWLQLISERLVTPPATPSPPSPPGVGNGDTIIHLVAPLEANNSGTVYDVKPDRASYEFIEVWTGPMSTVDYATAVQIGARFFPVRKRSGGRPPPFPSRFLGNTNAGPQGGGSIRSAQEQHLAARQLQIVHRIGGGGGIKPS